MPSFNNKKARLNRIYSLDEEAMSSKGANLVKSPSNNIFQIKRINNKHLTLEPKNLGL